MNENEARNIFCAVDVLYAASSDLIAAIDGVGDNDERRTLRRKYAHLIAEVEKSFVYDICVSNPEFSKHKPPV